VLAPDRLVEGKIAQISMKKYFARNFLAYHPVTGLSWKGGRHQEPLGSKCLSVNNSNFPPADYGCCSMDQSDIAGKGFFITNQDCAKPVKP
jgi:hypothetical protein